VIPLIELTASGEAVGKEFAVKKFPLPDHGNEHQHPAGENAGPM